jgi:ketosteroid isomerase-like protein
VARARAQQAAFSELDFHIHERVEAGDKLVIAFRQRGRHTGPLVSALGVVPATGKLIERLIIDVITLREGRVSEIRVVGDDLGMLNSLGAVQLKAS